MKTYMVTYCETVVWCLVPKNASSSMNFHFKKYPKHWFKKNGLQYSPKPWAKIFAHIQHPESRWVKGITQYAIHNKMEPEDFKDSKIQAMTVGAHDMHTYPISFLFHDVINKIEFIPIDTDIGTMQELTNAFFKTLQMYRPKVGPFQMADNKFRHKADEKKEEFYKVLYEWIDSDQKLKNMLIHELYYEDYRHYLKTLDKYATIQL